MRKVAILLLLPLLFGCEKTVEKAQTNLLVQLMTSGQWKVSLYTKGGSDVSTDFSGYSFQFKDNNTVDAIKNNVVEKTGTWKGDINARTIESYFNNASVPLTLLNGLWTITNSTMTSVDAKQTINSEECVLHLDKL